ncbi:MAG: hypothetical protein FD123_3577 [Bacteroidetes bacterium]|nr:MAG: hypothetical protein FD123_3577 [Bacteroidota bacterium]
MLIYTSKLRFPAGPVTSIFCVFEKVSQCNDVYNSLRSFIVTVPELAGLLRPAAEHIKLILHHQAFFGLLRSISNLFFIIRPFRSASNRLNFKTRLHFDVYNSLRSL